MRLVMNWRCFFCVYCQWQWHVGSSRVLAINTRPLNPNWVSSYVVLLDIAYWKWIRKIKSLIIYIFHSIIASLTLLSSKDVRWYDMPCNVFVYSIARESNMCSYGVRNAWLMSSPSQFNFIALKYIEWLTSNTMYLWWWTQKFDSFWHVTKAV